LVFVYIGSYTESPDGSGEGIAVFRFDAASGRLTLVQTVTGVANPSFAVLDSRQRCLYAVNELDDGGAWFPGLGFLQLLFGRRSLAELEHAAADCRVNAEEARVLLDALFPKRPSCVWPAV